jgi:peptidyl-prolyl cis-trans isomerase SurA
MKNKISIFLFVIILPIFCQIKTGQSIDKVLAVVGKEFILQSDIDGQMLQYMSRTQGVDFNNKEMRAQILEAIIGEKLLIAKALEDSVDVSDDEVNQRWSMLLSNLVSQYGSEKRVEDVLGKSLPRVKFEYSDQIRKRLLADKVRALKFQGTTVTKQEVENFYKEYKDSLMFIPDMASLLHIVKYVSTSASVKEKTLELVNKVRDSILNGSDFGELAKRYSGDYLSAKDKGNLGWIGKGKLFNEFEKAAFALQKGETSLPIETPFGYHLIQTLDKKQDEINTRHILFKVGQSNEDKDRVINELKSIKAKAEAGEDFEKLAQEYSEEKETKGFGGKYKSSMINQLELELNTKNLKAGYISEPIVYNVPNDPTKSAFHIIFIKDITQGHKASLELDYKIIERYAIELKTQKEQQAWFNELKKEIYFELKQ